MTQMPRKAESTPRKLQKNFMHGWPGVGWSNVLGASTRVSPNCVGGHSNSTSGRCGVNVMDPVFSTGHAEPRTFVRILVRPGAGQQPPAIRSMAAPVVAAMSVSATVDSPQPRPCIRHGQSVSMSTSTSKQRQVRGNVRVLNQSGAAGSPRFRIGRGLAMSDYSSRPVGDLDAVLDCPSPRFIRSLRTTHLRSLDGKVPSAIRPQRGLFVAAGDSIYVLI